MTNKFLEHADKKWEENGLFVEAAILLLGRLLNGEADEIADSEVEQCRTNLLRTLMTDTPSGMFQCALESMIEGKI